MTTALGRTSTYLVERLSAGGRRRVNTCACGGQTMMMESTDGSRTVTYPDGVNATQEEQPDPRFGMIAPLLNKATFRTPAGLEAHYQLPRRVTLSDPDNPLSLATLTDKIDSNGRTGTTTFHASNGRNHLQHSRGATKGCYLGRPWSCAERPRRRTRPMYFRLRCTRPLDDGGTWNTNVSSHL